MQNRQYCHREREGESEGNRENSMVYKMKA